MDGRKSITKRALAALPLLYDPCIMRTLILCFCLLILPLALSADEVHLTDGRILSGEIIDNPADGKLVFKSVVGSMSMTLRIERHKIVKIVEGKTDGQIAIEQIQKQRKALEAKAQMDADQLWALALELDELKHSLLYKQYARDVIKYDPDHAAAHRALDHVFFDGTWMTEREMHLARGEVYFEGKWMAKSVRDDILKEREEQRLAAAERRAERIAARKERRDRERAEAFVNIKYRTPTIQYGGVRLYHGTHCNAGLPLSGHRYGSSSSHHHGFNFSASGSQSWGNWSLNYR